MYIFTQGIEVMCWCVLLLIGSSAECDVSLISRRVHTDVSWKCWWVSQIMLTFSLASTEFVEINRCQNMCEILTVMRCFISEVKFLMYSCISALHVVCSQQAVIIKHW